jgi:hypothetical protein
MCVSAPKLIAALDAIAAGKGHHDFVEVPQVGTTTKICDAVQRAVQFVDLNGRIFPMKRTASSRVSNSTLGRPFGSNTRVSLRLK